MSKGWALSIALTWSAGERAPDEHAGPPVVAPRRGGEEPTTLDELEFEELPDPAPEPGEEPEAGDDTKPMPAPTPDAQESATEAPAPPEPAPEPTPQPEAEEDLQPRVEPSKHGPGRTLQFPRTWFDFTVSPGPRWVGFGAGFTYFFIPHLGAGLDLMDTIYFKAPGTINVFELTPTLTFLALPRYRVTPLLEAGVGGAFFSHHLGNYGRWITQGGVAFKIAQRVFLSLLAGPTGYLPDSRYRRNFYCAFIYHPCSLGFALDLGIGIGF